MTGNLDMGTNKIFGDNLQVHIGDSSHFINGIMVNWIGFWSLIAKAATNVLTVENRANATLLLQTKYGGIQTCATLKSVASGNGEFSIERAGDISLGTQKYLKIGEIPTSVGLPAAGAGYHMKTIVLVDDESGGNPDKFYICLTDGAVPTPSYDWVEISRG